MKNFDPKRIEACRRAVEIVRECLTTPHPKLSNPTPRLLPGKFFKVRLVKSTIGLPKQMKEMVRKMGFKSVWMTRYLPVTKEFVGSLTRARHLVEIDLVDDIPPAIVPKDKGYQIVGNWLGLKAKPSIMEPSKCY